MSARWRRMGVRARVWAVQVAMYVALTPIAFVTGLANSVAFLTALSLWALVLSAGAALEASLTADELEQHEDETEG